MNQDEGAALVARYYDKLQWLYSLGWGAGGTRSLHYGLWWDDTRSLGEAIRNGDRFVGDKLAITAGDHVLDMGCGVGGTSVYLAETFGCRVTGITVSRVQLAKAREHAAARGVADRVEFALADYTSTHFADGTFTKAFTQETSNYAVDKRRLLAEVHRILAPGGAYVSLDAFQRRDAQPGAETARLAKLLRGWASTHLEPFDRYVELAGEVGLRVGEHGDVTPRTLASARAIWWRHIGLYPLVIAARAMRLVSPELLWHFEASLAQKQMFGARDHVLMFGYLAATKP